MEAVHECHPNNPDLVLPEAERLTVLRNDEARPTKRRDGSDQKVCFDDSLTLVVPHQGDHHWDACWSEGDEDAQVFIYENYDDNGDGDETPLSLHCHLVAPTVHHFVWDLAQTGLIWYHSSGYFQRFSIASNDIGVVPLDNEDSCDEED